MTIDKGILIKNIYYMLAYAAQQPRFIGINEIDSENFEEIHDLFAWILLRGMSYQLKQGLHREYVNVKENRSSLRGKLEINGSINNRIQRKQLLCCEYDELSENNILNQVLKTAALFLFKHPDVKRERKHDLQRILIFFDNVNVVKPSQIRWNILRFDRNTRTYQLMMIVCQFIFNDMLMTTQEGNYRMKGLSDDSMCRLYEKFILEYYRRHHPETNARASKLEWNIIKEGTTTSLLPAMQTDITLSLGERTLIIDAKYYSHSVVINMGKKQLHTANLYQINTYVTNADTNHSGNVDGMLLYAKTQEEVTPKGEMKLHDGNIISFRCLDLNKEFKFIAKQLEDIICNYNTK